MISGMTAIVRGSRVALDADPAPIVVMARPWQIRTDAHGLDGRKRLQLRGKTLEKPGSIRGRRVRGTRQRDRCRQHVLGAEARVGAEKPG